MIVLLSFRIDKFLIVVDEVSADSISLSAHARSVDRATCKSVWS